MTPPRAIHTDREQARERLTAKIEDQRRLLDDPHGFSTVDPNYLIADAEFRLRWIDCAPEGANHLTAPLQGRYGVPCGDRGSYAVGPGRELRDAIERRTGRSWQAAKIAQHEAVVA